MTTHLTPKEFENRLHTLTQIGDPEIMGSPFSEKPFYGEINKQTFRLAKNTVFPPTGYLIDGTYSGMEATGTKLTYEVKPILFAYYWIRFAPIFFFFIMNGLLFFNMTRFQWTPYIVINVFLSLIYVLGVSFDKFQRKRFEKIFKERFKIVV